MKKGFSFFLKNHKVFYARNSFSPKNHKAQVWIETVIYTLIAFVMIGLVLAYAQPKIEELQDKAIIEQSIGVIEDINTLILAISQGGAGNTRLIELKIKKGVLKIDGVNDKIIFEMESKYTYSQPGEEINIGNIVAHTQTRGKYNLITLTSDYSRGYNITYQREDIVKSISKSSTSYNLLISNKGHDGDETLIDVRVMGVLVEDEEEIDEDGEDEEECVDESVETTCGAWVCGIKENNCGNNVNCLPGCDDGFYCDEGVCTEGICIPDCSCANSTCINATCIDSNCSTSCNGTLEPDCGTRECGDAPNSCGGVDECGVCSVGECVDGSCVLVGVVLLEDGFEDYDWDAKWDANDETDWSQVSNLQKSGSYSVINSGSDKDDDLVSDDLDASDASEINIFFWYSKDDIENNDFEVEIYDGEEYNFWWDLDVYEGVDNCAGSGGDDKWCRFNETITDAQYFKSNFRLKFEGSGTDRGENVWIDDVKITKL